MQTSPLTRMPYRPLWELLLKNADSMKLKYFAEMSSLWWKSNIDSTFSRNQPCLLLLPACSGIPRSWGLCTGKNGNAHSSPKQKVSQCLGSLQTWDFWAAISSAATLKLATLNRETWGGWAANFFAKDSLSRIFLLSWEEKAGKHDFWWENEQLRQFHGLGWFLENLLGMVCFYCPHPATGPDQLTYLCVFTPCSSLVHFKSYNYCCAGVYLSRGLLAQLPNRPTRGWWGKPGMYFTLGAFGKLRSNRSADSFTSLQMSRAAGNFSASEWWENQRCLGNGSSLGKFLTTTNTFQKNEGKSVG